MLQKLLITTALSGLMLSSALAQSSSPPSSSPSATPPSASSPSATPPSASSTSTDPMKADAPKSSDASKSTSASASTISSQKPDQLLATKIKGADVMGADDKKIGDVSDLLFSKEGKLEAYVISVGGFLGVGAKEVALAPSSVQLTQDKDSWKLKVSASKDQLAQAPNFERHKDTTSTTSTTSTTGASSAGSGSSSSSSAPRNAPSGGMAPSGNPPPANRP